MTDGTNPPSNPQPEPAPGSGGYGFPPGPPAPGGYGFPPAQPGGYGFPPAQGGGYGYPPPGGGFGAAQPFSPEPGGGAGGQWPAGPDELHVASGSQPDWDAMADRAAAERRRKRLWMLGGGVTVLALLAGGGTFLLLNRGGDDGKKDVVSDQPSASASADPSGPADNSPTVAGDPSTLRDGGGKADVKLGPDAAIGPYGKRFELRLKGNENSYGQTAAQIVDTSKSFTLAVRAYNSATKGPRMAMSQGDGDSFSFELGLDEVNGKQAWVFRVQTGDKGDASTVKTIAAEGVKTLKESTVLTASYDAEKKTITLYVEGKKAAETQVPGIWQGSGPLQLGRARHAKGWAAPWQGTMVNIRTYSMAFTPEQASTYNAGKTDAAVKKTMSHSWLTG
ncbi:LamG-like jellyroll fold domain-containing protein [Streptomyces sp. NPDC085524]|uniref:LamG-like jellyroll fold domain-containing protein n=1 Tax=unclassified Streptomyces TaxID=2593676 RepID=UPI0035D5EA22